MVENQIQISDIRDYFAPTSYPILISGPCSAESEEQMLATARGLVCIPQVRIFRAGIWKPRTRPGGFEGAGEKGLQWLKKVKTETGLLTCTEVVRPSHIELALKYDVDLLWIGARSTVNPFLVQELAEALKGTNIPVFVKNPVNPDLKLWIGALERFSKAGISKLGAIHRGFYFFERTNYRNAPMWEIPIELKRQIPDLPIIVDPSHICGNRENLAEISQKALDLDMHGLMIETHYNPDNALTDSKQQISPESLKQLMAQLSIRKRKGDKASQCALEQYRSEIDKIDIELLDILARRMDIVREIAAYKKDHNITILQIKRWQNIINDRLTNGMNRDLDKDFLLKLLQLVHKESIQVQNRIMNTSADQ